MILSLFILTLTATVGVALIFELLAQHLGSFLKLALPCRTAFALIISPFTAGGFPAFESLWHAVAKLRLTLSYQNSYSIASNLSKVKKIYLLISLMICRFSEREAIAGQTLRYRQRNKSKVTKSIYIRPTWTDRCSEIARNGMFPNILS